VVISCNPAQPAIEKTGQMASRERFRRDAGHRGQKTGRPGKIGTSGNPNQRRPVAKMWRKARFPFKCTHRMQRKHLHCVRCVRNRIDSIVVFSCARTACVSCVTCACVLLFFACVIFLCLLRFLRTFYIACCLCTFPYARCCMRLNGNRA